MKGGVIGVERGLRLAAREFLASSDANACVASDGDAWDISAPAIDAAVAAFSTGVDVIGLPTRVATMMHDVVREVHFVGRHRLAEPRATF